MDVDSYLAQFGDVSKLERSTLLQEMDTVWDHFGLDNSGTLASQFKKATHFYNHPVWVLNGLFSEADPVSRGHREAIVQYLNKLSISRVADYGGGGGVLARFISTDLPWAEVDIVEPYPADYFLRDLANMGRVQYVSRLRGPYDAVIAQDVLEHVDDPAGLALELVDAVRLDGYLVFANCFYPIIKCHLPATFYLRHQFGWLMRFAGLKHIGHVPGASHAHVFQRKRPVDRPKFRRANTLAKRVGPTLNAALDFAKKTKQVLKFMRIG
jgi:2-polyprenyl-6-hydroxyphenyl methylase/3-demethylubiquinone-9 3-methyltransferase